MNIAKKLTGSRPLLIISALFLCGCQETTVEEPSLWEASGIWDATERYGDYVDVKYIVIKEHGELVVYDYAGDPFDNYGDCYYQHSESIVDLGDGFFEVSETYGLRTEYTITEMSIYNDELYIRYKSDDLVLERAYVSEEDFYPICTTDYDEYLNNNMDNKHSDAAINVSD